MDLLRGAMIGCGWVTQMHAEAYRRAPRAKIVAAADLSEERLAAARELLGITESDCATDYRDLLARDEVDFVSISTNNHMHRPMVLEAARAGKHVLCEKALANNLRDADEMLRATESAGLKLAVYHEGAFYPENSLAKKILTEEWGCAPRTAWSDAWAIGKWHMPAWVNVPEIAGGGILMSEGVHLAHLNRFYFGEDPIRVTALMDLIDPQWAPVEDVAVCAFEFPSGVGSTRTSYAPAIGREETMCVPGHGIVAAEGSIEFVYPNGAEGPYSPADALLVRTKDGVRRYALPACPDPLEKNTRAFVALIEDFVDCVTGDDLPVVNGAIGRTAVEMVLAAYLSAATGRAVDLPLDPASPVYNKGVLGLVDCASDVPSNSKFRRRGLFGFEALPD